MLVIGFIVLAGAVVATLLRTLALSPAAARLTVQQVWRFDFGSRYVWLTMGLALLVLAVYRGASLPTLSTLTAYWLIGLAAIWLLPPHLSSLF